MYVLLLISKYLRRKLAPLFACLAVVLCTAMVIIVMSVMMGFLAKLQSSAQRLSGDVIVQAGSITGFEGYEDLIERLEALPEVAVATPVIDVPGLVKIGTRSIPIAQVVGVEPTGYDAVVGYAGTMYWQDHHRVALHDRIYGDPSMQSEAELALRAEWEQLGFERLGAELRVPPGWQQRIDEALPVSGAIVPGLEVSPYNWRDDQGEYDFDRTLANDGSRVILTVLPLTRSGGLLEPETRAFATVNEFKSGLYEVDANRVYVPLDVLQGMLGMDEGIAIGEDGLPTGETIPGRVTEVLAKSADGVPLEAVADAARRVVNEWELDHETSVFTITWQDRHGRLLSAVANEVRLVVFLFGVTSLVAVFMVLITFWMIVRAQTRDIGTLRAIGASRIGILSLFVGYGLAVGVLGAALGTAVGTWIVVSLNEVQFFLANYAGVTTTLIGSVLVGAAGGAVIATAIGFVNQRMRWWLVRLTPIVAVLCFVPLLIGVAASADFASWLNATIRFEMWNPQTYYFDEIPNQIDAPAVAIVAVCAVLSSTLGAVIPALVASANNPVEALRHE
ncbi:MAG: FtsX-like permease family protein [Planctomycetota bacterium]